MTKERKYGKINHMKKVLLLSSLFVSLPAFILFCAIFLLAFSSGNRGQAFTFADHPSTVAYAALPSIDSQISESIEQKDSRVEIVNQFFARYKSPLVPHAEDVVRLADMYGLDFRLVPAIGMQESNLCAKAPVGSNNCWGYGIYGKKVITFDNYTQAIEAVTKNLSINYKDIGLITPEQIMTKHTPSSDGSWARAIHHFMDEMR